MNTQLTKANSFFLIVGLMFAVVLFLFTSAETAAPTTVIKTVDEEVTAEDAPLQNDDELSLTLQKNKKYVITGAILMKTNVIGGGDTFTNVLSLVSPSGSVMRIAYSDALNNLSGVLSVSGEPQILPFGIGQIKGPILVSGIIETGNQPGTLQLQWGHNAPDFNEMRTTIEKGSYLRAEEIQ